MVSFGIEVTFKSSFIQFFNEILVIFLNFNLVIMYFEFQFPIKILQNVPTSMSQNSTTCELKLPPDYVSAIFNSKMKF